jgi:acetyl-CoA carboxylase biotin carboxyl carrier protein
MVLSQDDVIQILRLMDESDYNELRLETGDLKIVVNKRGEKGLSEANHVMSEGDAGSLAVEETVTRLKPEDSVLLPSVTAIETQDTASAIEKEIAEKGFIPVKSPMLGTFYRSPKPGDPPFVETGAKVSEETAICIIEVMKLFSTIHAGLRGKISKVCAEDGQLVEYDQVLFLVDKEIT